MKGRRYYDSVLGRWLSRDILKGILVRPSSMNRYVYAFNNPLLYIDLDGRFSKVEVNNAFRVFQIYEFNHTRYSPDNPPPRLGGNNRAGQKDYQSKYEFIDCSGLVTKMYPDYFGKNIKLNKSGTRAISGENNAQMMYNMSDKIRADSVQVGDLVFFENADGDIKHVGVVSKVMPGGHVQYVESAGGKGVREETKWMQIGDKRNANSKLKGFGSMGSNNQASRDAMNKMLETDDFQNLSTSPTSTKAVSGGN